MEVWRPRQKYHFLFVFIFDKFDVVLSSPQRLLTITFEHLYYYSGNFVLIMTGNSKLQTQVKR